VRTTDPAICSLIADSLQQKIAHLDKQGVAKWIIDLRNNTGGNCWPMLAGLGPLLGDGVCGYFVSQTDKVPISYQNGVAEYGPYARCEVPHPYSLKSGYKQIIVITGPKTCSSGEIIALAFKGKDRVSFYGECTAGFTTVNTTYNLSDSSMLVLTVRKIADCKGAVCEGKIIPEELIAPDPHNKANDLVKTAAVMWLQSL
jgi:C-terminal processing protease CtpA/Prc